MNSGLKKTLQISLLCLLALAALRAAYIFHQRKEAASVIPREDQNTIHHKLTADNYVYERPFHGYDLASTKQELAHAQVWMKAGNYYSYYPYDSSSHRADFDKPAGILPPLAKLEITDVILQPAKKGRQLMVVFQFPGDTRLFAAPAGAELNGNYNIAVADGFYRQDPHELYKHWDAETWAAIERNEPKRGMNEIQMGMALGVGGVTELGSYGNRSLRYENAGRPFAVRFVNNEAVSIEPAR